MKCPDCANRLTEVPVEGGFVHRCFKCGGFWVDSNTVNRLTSDQLSSWRRISPMNPIWTKGDGKGICPADGTYLTRYIGEAVPPNMTVTRCARCGRWWFPGDSLFAYKPAVEAKVNYFHKWGISSQMGALALPVLLIAVLTMGTVAGVRLVNRQQQDRAAASMGLKELAVTYLGQGNALVVFKLNQPVNQVELKPAAGGEWQTVAVAPKDGYYLGNIAGLAEEKEYLIKVAGKEFKFTAK